MRQGEAGVGRDEGRCVAATDALPQANSLPTALSGRRMLKMKR